MLDLTEVINMVRRESRVDSPEAGQIADKIHELKAAATTESAPAIEAVLSAFKTELGPDRCQILISEQMDYAIRMAELTGGADLETAIQLFSICDLVQVLADLDFPIDPLNKQAWENALRGFINRERSLANMACQTCLDDRNKDHWWYAEVLKGSREWQLARGKGSAG